MNEAIKTRKAMTETEEVAQLLEKLDFNSKLLAKTYLSALADRQKIEEIREKVATI